jgi:hypothetical protein
MQLREVVKIQGSDASRETGVDGCMFTIHANRISLHSFIDSTTPTRIRCNSPGGQSPGLFESDSHHRKSLKQCRILSSRPIGLCVGAIYTRPRRAPVSQVSPIRHHASARQVLMLTDRAIIPFLREVTAGGLRFGSKQPSTLQPY